MPFIARYRKEATGSLDDGQLRTLEERLRYLRELDERRGAVLASIEEQGKLTDDLRAALVAATTKARVEDIYLPYKPKRRTKAQIARKRDSSRWPTGCSPTPPCSGGCGRSLRSRRGPRHGRCVGRRTAHPRRTRRRRRRTRRWHSRQVLVASLPADRPMLAGNRQLRCGAEISRLLRLHRGTGHRAVAPSTCRISRRKEKVLGLTFDGGHDAGYEAMVAHTLGIDMSSEAAATSWLATTVSLAWRARLLFSATVDARTRLRQRAEQEAVAVFAENFKDLLLAAPAGARTTLGLDPGYRTGVKVAVVDGTGKVVDTCAIFPHQPQRQWDSAKATLAALVARHGVELIAVGNGTASRETDALAAELIADIRAAGAPPPVKAMVSEAGASVYSASAYAAHELPGLDVTLRARCRSLVVCRIRWPNW